MKKHSYSHIGKKTKNEDFVASNKKCLLVCDGVGGAIKGETASLETASYILKNFKEKLYSEEKVIEIINEAQQHLNELVQREPLLDGMATTLAALFFTPKKGIYTAHMGDSRVYIVKPRKQLFWQTWDHSFVSNLLKNGEITREEARKHPMNNQISNALKGNLENVIKEPEIHFIDDVEVNDICFICSDGISESFSDYELLKLLSLTDISIEEKLYAIKSKCLIDSRDNHSAIICEFETEDLPIKSTNKTSWESIKLLKKDSKIEQIDLKKISKENQLKKRKPNRKWWKF